MSSCVSQKAVILIGGGGHASVIADILKRQNREIRAIISLDDVSSRQIFNNIEILNHDDQIYRFDPEQVSLVNCIGAMPGSFIRKKINKIYLDKGYDFETVISDEAFISPYATLNPGVQILNGAIIQTGAVIGSHTVVNSAAVIEHDSVVGEYNFVAPGVVLCGQCRTEEDVFIGANATVIQNIQLGKGTVVTANALVTKNTLPGQKVSAQRSVIR